MQDLAGAVAAPLSRGALVPRDLPDPADGQSRSAVPQLAECFARRCSRNELPVPESFSSSRSVQSQSQHAQGSVPFSCRQFRRECASFTDNRSKYSSQYGRSSARGGSQKHVSTQCASPFASTRAISILC